MGAADLGAILVIKKIHNRCYCVISSKSAKHFGALARTWVGQNLHGQNCPFRALSPVGRVGWTCQDRLA